MKMIGCCLRGSKSFKYSLLFSSVEDKMVSKQATRKALWAKNFDQSSYKVLYSLTLKNVILVMVNFM